MILAQEYGTSLGPTIQPENLVTGNTLGENGAELSLNEIFEKFIMVGLPDLPVTYGTIEMTREASSRFRKHASELTLKKVKEHKQRMAKLGFPFD